MRRKLDEISSDDLKRLSNKNFSRVNEIYGSMGTPSKLDIEKAVSEINSKNLLGRPIITAYKKG